MIKKATHYLVIVLLAFVVSLSYQLFVFPNRFAPAGLNGLCTIVQHLFGISIGYLNLLINIPLAVAVYCLVSKHFAIRSMVYALSFSGFTLLLEQADLSAFAYATGNSSLLGPLVAGLISGASFALLGKVMSSSGGTEFVAKLIHRKFPHVNFYWVVFSLDCSVAALSYFVFGYKMEPVLLCILYCYASSSIRDQIAQKSRSAIRFEIITDQPEELSQAIIQRLHHSVTLLPAKGMYSGKETSLLVCVVNKSQTAALISVINDFPGSFATFGRATAVIGNFKRLDSRGKPEKQVL